jgi:long-chain fatty acid transport protein
MKRFRFVTQFLYMSMTCAVVVSALPAPTRAAIPMGSEFDSTMSPAAGGMLGIGTVRPQDPLAAIFSNPSTLTQTRGSNEFLVGLTYGNLDLRADDSPSGAFGGYKGDSNLRDIALPHFAAVHRFNDRMVGSIGITAVSGLGGDFRDDPPPGFPPNTGPLSDLKVFAGAFSGAYKFNDSFSAGASMIVGIGMFQGGLFSQSATVNGYGVAGQMGMTLSPQAVPLAFGVSYRTEMNLAFDDQFQVNAVALRGLSLEQPWQIAAGIATTEAFSENTLLAFEWRFKKYGDAEFYQDIWKDQHSINFGIQQTIPAPIVGKLKLRAGYRYAFDLAKDFDDLGTSIAGESNVFVPGLVGGTVVTINPVVLNLFQVTAANGYWAQAASLGVGAELGRGVEFDLYGAYSFDGSHTVGLFRAKQHFFHLGFGFTWRFN